MAGIGIQVIAARKGPIYDRRGCVGGQPSSLVFISRLMWARTIASPTYAEGFTGVSVENLSKTRVIIVTYFDKPIPPSHLAGVLANFDAPTRRTAVGVFSLLIGT